MPYEEFLPMWTSGVEMLTSGDPEPPVGTVVEDRNGKGWIRIYQPLGGTYWVDVADLVASDPESWVKVAGNYGPVRVVREG